MALQHPSIHSILANLPYNVSSFYRGHDLAVLFPAIKPNRRISVPT